RALTALQEWLRQYGTWRETRILAQEDRQKISGGLPAEYRLLVSLYARMHRDADALQVAELTKGRSLLENLTVEYALQNGELPASDVSRLRELDERAGELGRAAQEIVDDPPRRAQAIALRNGVLRQAQVLQASLRERYP